MAKIRLLACGKGLLWTSTSAVGSLHGFVWGFGGPECTELRTFPLGGHDIGNAPGRFHTVGINSFVFPIC